MIAIIGAGPVGNYVSYLLAKKNNDVRVFEEHKEIGKPVQCTGIVTQEIENVIKMKKSFIVNKVNKVKIYSPNKNCIDVKLKRENLIIDRTKFDSYLADLALDAGVRFELRKKYEGNRRGKMQVSGKDYDYDKLIGCDGPNSLVARENGILGKRRFVVGSQVRVKTDFDVKQVEFWLGIGQFGWLVPENDDVARVGVVSYTKPSMHLNELLKKMNRKYKIIDKQGGLIPLYNPKQVLQRENVYLVGDAATQVKATTFGGLVPGLMAAKVLAKDPDNYQANMRKELGRDLRLNLMIRKMMDNFSEEDYNDLIGMFGKDHVREIIETHDRDFPSKFMLKLLLREPRLLKFSKRLVF